MIEANNIKVTNTLFPKLKEFLHNVHFDIDLKTRENRLLQYSNGESFKIPSTEYIDEYEYTARKNVADDLSFSSYIKLCNCLYECLAGKCKKDNLNKITLNYYWGLRLNIFIYKQNVIDFMNGKRVFINTGLSIDDIVFLIAHLFILGWDQEARQLAFDLIEIINLNSEVVSGVESNERPSDAQFFILKLLNSQLDWRIPSEISFNTNVGVYNEIFKLWSSNDVEKLNNLYLSAGNRHINESKFFDSDKKFIKYYDFGKYEFFYYPFELLVVERLRFKNDLSLVDADHFLLQTDLGRLPISTNSKDYYDEFLINLIKRVKTEYPVFAEDFQLPNHAYLRRKKWKLW